MVTPDDTAYRNKLNSLAGRGDGDVPAPVISPDRRRNCPRTVMPDDAASFAPDAHPCLRRKSGSRFRDGHAAKGDVSHKLTKPIRTDEKRSVPILTQIDPINFRLSRMASVELAGKVDFPRGFRMWTDASRNQPVHGVTEATINRRRQVASPQAHQCRAILACRIRVQMHNYSDLLMLIRPEIVRRRP